MPKKKPSDGNDRNGKPTSDQTSKSARAASSAPQPRWCPRTLWFEDCVVKKFGRPVRDVELLLAAFEEQGWPLFIDDPLPPIRGRNRKTRLQGAIRNFNRRLDSPLIRLRGNGFGTGIGWEATLSTTNDNKRHKRTC
jgi:hypothetical protein